jgi:dienelactone hydrolase
LIAIAWRPILRPLGAGAVIVADIYSSALWDRNLAAVVTPAPRVLETTETIHGVATRVTWFVPGWGDRHPALMLVNGATELGNDDPETRRLAEALARAGYLVMLPEFPFIKQAVLEREATAYVDDAFAVLVRRPDTRGMPRGAFGFSVGGGMLLAAAASSGALASASYVGALGAYFDLDTYLASVLGGAQRRSGDLVPWDPDPEVRLKLPVAAAEALADSEDRARVIEVLRATGGRLSGDPPSGLGSEAVSLWSALTATQYDVALDRLRSLPPTLRDVLERLSPSAMWSRLRTPVFWLHDVDDRFEPVAEAEAAAATAHPAATRLQKTALLSHARALGSGARERGIDFWAAELSGLLVFATEALAAGS